LSETGIAGQDLKIVGFTQLGVMEAWLESFKLISIVQQAVTLGARYLFKWSHNAHRRAHEAKITI
jgi:hypothetical protein